MPSCALLTPGFRLRLRVCCVRSGQAYTALSRCKSLEGGPTAPGPRSPSRRGGTATGGGGGGPKAISSALWGEGMTSSLPPHLTPLANKFGLTFDPSPSFLCCDNLIHVRSKKNNIESHKDFKADIFLADPHHMVRRVQKEGKSW